MDTNYSIQDIFLFETKEYLEKIEQLLLESEKANEFSSSTIGEVFRIMHNIKSSSAMMNLNNISTLAHAVEDLFSFLREQRIMEILIRTCCMTFFLKAWILSKGSWKN